MNNFQEQEDQYFGDLEIGGNSGEFALLMEMQLVVDKTISTIISDLLENELLNKLTSETLAMALIEEIRGYTTEDLATKIEEARNT